MVDVGAVMIGKPLCGSEVGPSCGSVTGPSIESGIDKGFSEVDGMTVGFMSVIGETFEVEGQDAGCEIGNAHKYEEAGVVCHEGQALEF